MILIKKWSTQIWAQENQLPVKQFKAERRKYGKSAGLIRNRAMAEYADTLNAIWDGNSPGAKNMIETAKKLDLKVFIYNLGEQEKQ